MLLSLNQCVPFFKYLILKSWFVKNQSTNVTYSSKLKNIIDQVMKSVEEKAKKN